MSFIAGYILGLEEGGKKPVITTLTVTANGTYTAPDGVDGYSPVIVGVPDRYDEGYEQGYKDGCDDTKTTYEKIIRQLNGDGETVTDDNGNTIDNAIVADDDSEINDVLRGIVFPNGGGSVSVDGLTGADTYFRIDQVTTVYETGQTVKKMQLTLVNKLTGETKVVASSNGIQASSGSTVVWKINSVGFNPGDNRTSVRVVVMPYVDGVAKPMWSAALTGNVTNVGGTSFGSRGGQTAITQQGA